MRDDEAGRELRELEERLLRPGFRRSRPAVSALLAEDFIEYGSSGRIFDKQQILDLLGAEPEQRIAIAQFEARPLSADVVLVTYRSIRPDGPPEPGAAFLRSSLWVRRQGRWQIVFHQGTRAAPDLPGRVESPFPPAEPGEKIEEAPQ